MGGVRAWLAGVVVVGLGVAPAGAGAQEEGGLPAGYRLERLERPASLNTAGLLGLNVLVGGLGVGLVTELRGGSFLAGFRGGAVAGGVVFLGKTVAAQRFSGAGLAGRQLAAAGGSMASNVAAGEGAFSRFNLPFGPLLVSYSPATGDLGLRADPLGLAVVTYALLHPRLRFDAGATLSAGTPVFHGDTPLLAVPVSGASAVGLQLQSVILLADLSGLDARTRADIFAHERVHTIQADAFQAYWGRALLEWLTPESDGWQQALGVLDVNLGEASAELFDQFFSGRGVWEVEAEYIGRWR